MIVNWWRLLLNVLCDQNASNRKRMKAVTWLAGNSLDSWTVGKMVAG